MRRLIPVLSLVLALPAAAQTFTFEQVTIPLAGARHEAVGGTALAGLDGRQLMVVTRIGEDRMAPRRFRFLPITDDDLGSSEPVLEVDAPEGALFYELVDVESESLIRRQILVVLTADALLQLDPGRGRWSELASIPSLFRARDNPEFRLLDMAEDLDGDGFHELVVPTFEGYRLLSPAGASHGLVQSDLDMPVRMAMEGPHPEFRRFRPWVVDMDLDGRRDLVFVRDGELKIHRFLEDRSVAASAQILPAPMEVRDALVGDYVDIEDDTDQSDLTIHQLYRFQDVDGDGLADMVMRRTRSSGVFDKTTELAIHLGRREAEGLAFRGEPDFAYSADGIQFDAELEDLDADGRMELAVPVLELGVMKILGALLSSSVDYDLDIFRLGPEGTERPAFSRDVEVSFDLSTGFSRFPAELRADFDGDGLLDQLVQTGDDQITILQGTGDEDLFPRRGETLEVPLPSDGNDVSSLDLDDDGDADLVLRYGAADPEDQQGLIRILFSRGRETGS